MRYVVANYRRIYSLSWPLTGRKRRFKLILAYKKGHQGSNPGGHCFSFLYGAINKQPIFVSQVVNDKTRQTDFKQ